MIALKETQSAAQLPAFRARRFTIDGKAARQQDLAGLPFVVAGAGLPEEGTAYGFTQEEGLCRWAAGTRHADRFARAIGLMKLGQQLEGTEVGTRAANRHEVTSQRLLADLEELAAEARLPEGSPELLLQAAGWRSALEPPLFDPTLLFDKVVDSGLPPAFGGALFPVAGPIPTFFGFNDKASGAQVLGVCTLHDRTFFRGPAAFLIGAASFVLDDLLFDNRAASGIAV